MLNPCDGGQAPGLEPTLRPQPGGAQRTCAKIGRLWTYHYEEDTALLRTRPVALAGSGTFSQAGRHAAGPPRCDPQQVSDESTDGRSGAVNNIKALLRKGPSCKNLHYLLLKAQATAAPRTKFLVFGTAA